MAGRAVYRAAAAWLLAASVPLSGTAEVPAEASSGGQVRVIAGEAVHTLRVELARTPEQQRRGLMERERLAADAGMLFVYDRPQPGTHGFWMYRTRIPLDIAFLDAQGRILSIHQMVPCSVPAWACPRYRPGAAYSAALEVNAGYFAARGVQVGDRVEWTAE